MFRIISLVYLVASCLGPCGGFEIVEYAVHKSDLPQPDNKIVGGVSVSIADYPYQLAYVTTRPGSSSVTLCGASIISPLWALTAAHCATGNITNMYLRANSSYWSSGGKQYGIQQKYVHPKYSFGDYDLALLKIMTPFVFGSGVAIITLPTETQVTSDGSISTATGWGINSMGNVSTVLQMVKIPTINQTTCAAVYGAAITARVLCAMVSPPDSGKSICQGDSGGPLVYNRLLIGVSSFTSASGCGEKGMPAGFARVAEPELRGWIRQTSGV